MNLKKILVLLAGILALPTLVFAQGTATSSSQKIVTLATVNIQHTNIVSQAGHSLVISFDFTNREGLQTGVKYGVRLIAENPEKMQYIADSKIYDETIVLPEQSTTHREITYTAPSALAGTYALYLESSNGSGLLLAVAFVGKIDLAATGKGVGILPTSCFLTVAGEKGSPHYALTRGVDIASSETLLLNCAAKNNASGSRSAEPVFETHYRNAYGDIVAQTGGDTEPLLFAAGENRSFSISLSKATLPQAYDTLITLDTIDGPSNVIDVHYVLRGASATIQTLSLDKDQYRKGDSALLSLHWTGSADGFPNSRLGAASPSAATIEAALTGRDDIPCAAPVQEAVGAVQRSYNTDIRIPITAECLDPHIVVTLKDAQGQVLAQKDLVLTSPSNVQDGQTSSLLIAALLILLIVGIGGGVAFIRKEQGGASTLVVFLLAVAAGSIFPFDRAHADTYNFPSGLNWTINTNGTTFNPGDPISISAHGLGPDCGNDGGDSLYVQIPGVTPYYFIVEGYGGQVTSWAQVDVYGNITLTAPSPGNYSLLFQSYDRMYGSVAWADYLNVPFTVVSPCAANMGAACSSAPNACGQTQANGTIQCDGSCSSTPPSNASCPPDLTAGNTTPAPASGTTGQSESFSASVSNIGAGTASNFPNIFQIADSALTATVAMLNANTVASLGSGASTGVSGAYTFSSAGTYNVRACANYNTSWGGSISESNMNNNCGAWQSFSVAWAACANGANNSPTCNTCSDPLFWNGSSCVSCTGGCTGGVCNNGAVNPPSCNAFAPTATLSASPTTIDQGQSATLSWNSTNATSCTGTGFTAGGPSGSASTGVLNTAGTQNYQVVCSGAGGTSAPAFASVLVLSPTATISASPARVVSGSNTTLSWSASGVSSCVVTGPSGTLASGNADASHNFSTGSPMSAAITGQSTFTITCQTNGSPVTRSVTANVIAGFQEF